MHRHQSCTVTSHAPSPAMHRHESRTVTSHHRHQSCTVTSHAPSPVIHRPQLSTVNSHAPSPIMHRHAPCHRRISSIIDTPAHSCIRLMALECVSHNISNTGSASSCSYYCLCDCLLFAYYHCYNKRTRIQFLEGRGLPPHHYHRK